MPLPRLHGGPHPNDLDSLDGAVGVYEDAALREPPSLRRIGWSADWGYAAVDPEVRRVSFEAAKALASALGVELVEQHPGSPTQCQRGTSLRLPAMSC